MITIFKGSIEGSKANEYCEEMKGAIEAQGWPVQITDAKSAYTIYWQCSEHFEAIKDLPNYEQWEKGNG